MQDPKHHIWTLGYYPKQLLIKTQKTIKKEVHKDNHNGHLLHLNATRENNLHVPFTKVLVRFNHVCLATRLTLGDDEGLNHHLIPTSNLGSRKAW
jgi:hypothetical protein